VNQLSKPENQLTVIKTFMTDTQKKTLLKKLEKDKERAFSNNIPDAPALSEIVSKLNSIEKKDKPFFNDYAKNLKSELFAKSIIIKGFNLSEFNENLFPKPEDEPIIDPIESEVNFGFLDLYKHVVSNINEHFNVYKGYSILKLENNHLKPYKLLVLHDKSFIIEPIKKKLHKSILTEIVIKNVSEYLDDLSKIDNSENNYLCLLLLMPRINDKDEENELIINIRTLISSFNYFENISIKYLNDSIHNDYFRSIDKEDFIDEIQYICCTLLSNGAFNHEEEKIVKKLATNFKTPLVIYKTLKGGNSGSQVIEIRPKKELGEQYEKRYIIKYSEINDERKIRIEKQNFDEFIRGYKGFNDYECHYDKTLTHEGILYGYAIADTEKESYSYSDIISNRANPFYNDKIDFVDSLFNETSIYETWSNIVEKKHCSVSQLYSEYINVEKILQQLCSILNKSPVQIETDELIKNFRLIWKYESEFDIKICHGDLHTDNLFKDCKGIYLIDFGFTGKKHSPIDHASLECSIKFKHFPSYIESNELIDIENELTLETSFQRSTKFTKTTRHEVIDLLEIIKSIRNNAIQKDYIKTEINYFISLFIMTFRQIKYKDLNQLYSYHSALVISKRIIQILGLRHE
jgi:hypothetical protein